MPQLALVKLEDLKDGAVFNFNGAQFIKLRDHPDVFENVVVIFGRHPYRQGDLLNIALNAQVRAHKDSLK